jgi:hypothetical protein
VNNNFRYLLIALLVFLAGVPLAFDLNILPAGAIRLLGFSMLLVIGIWSLRKSGRIFHFAIGLVTTGIAMNILNTLYASSFLFIGSQFSMLAFLMLATVAASRQVAVGTNMSVNRIVGAICIYLLLGVIWSILYALIEFAVPGSFSGLTGQGVVNWHPDWMYYSFITLTTLGYGDITPLSFSARALSYMEAIVGQFYIAVMVAGLVSAYITAKTNDHSDN